MLHTALLTALRPMQDIIIIRYGLKRYGHDTLRSFKRCGCLFQVFVYIRLYSAVSLRKLIIFFGLIRLKIVFTFFDLKCFSFCSLNSMHSVRICLKVRLLLHRMHRCGFSPLGRITMGKMCISYFQPSVLVIST